MEQTERDARIEELKKAKKKLNESMRRHRKMLAKNRLAKRRLDEELKNLKGDKNIFLGKDKKTVGKLILKKLNSVKVDEVYPPQLEREFEKIEKRPNIDEKVADIDVVAEVATLGDILDDEEGVIDLSDE